MEKSEPRPRERKFAKVSTGLIYKTLKNLNPDAKGEYSHNVPNIVHDLIRDVVAWASDKISDKKFCGCLFIHCHNLMALFDLFSKEKEVGELIKDQTAYEEEYAKRSPEPEDHEIPF